MVLGSTCADQANIGSACADQAALDDNCATCKKTASVLWRTSLPFQRESRILLVILFSFVIFPRHVCPARLPLPGLPGLSALARFHLAGLRARTARRLPALVLPALVFPSLVFPAWSSRTCLPALAFPALGASLYVSLLFLGILYENICPLFGTPKPFPMGFTNCLQTMACTCPA